MTDQPAPTAKPDVSNLSFEQALKQLEDIVQELESGRAPLEQSVELYALGAELKQHCERKLEAARLRVERIVMGPNGPERTEPAEFG